MAYMRMNNDRGFLVLLDIEDWKVDVIRHGKILSFAVDEIDTLIKIDWAMNKIKALLVTDKWPTTPYYLRKVRKGLFYYGMDEGE